MPWAQWAVKHGGIILLLDRIRKPGSSFDTLPTVAALKLPRKGPLPRAVRQVMDRRFLGLALECCRTRVSSIICPCCFQAAVIHGDGHRGDAVPAGDAIGPGQHAVRPGRFGKLVFAAFRVDH